MIKVDIQKKVEQLSNPQDALLKEAEVLLLKATNEDHKYLKAAGLDHQIREAQADHAKMIVGKELRTKFGLVVVTEKDVKDMCIKYKLKFLQSKFYNGTVPPELGAVISRFMAKLEEPNPEYAAGENLFIMAPAKMFNTVSYTVKDAPKDPVLFYRFTTTEGTFYAIVSKWGNDFTIFRAIQGWIFKNPKNFELVAILVAMLSSFTIASLLISNMLGFCITIALLSVAIWIWRGSNSAYWDNNNERKRGYEAIFSEKGWNQLRIHEYSIFEI